MLIFVAGVLAAALLAAALATAGYAIADRLLGEAPTSARAAATATVALWLAIALFWMLAPFGGFRLAVVAPALVLVAVLAGRGRSLGVRLRSDLVRVRAAWRELGWVRWLVVAVAVPCALLAARGLAAPPLAWDSLTYHLVRAARFVQWGGLHAQAAPDASGYYETIPPHAEIVWAWIMLGPHGDALLAVGGLVVHGLLVLALAAAGRALGAPLRRAVLIGLAVASSPALLSLVTAAYVDPLGTAVFALALLWLVRALGEGRPADLALAAAALAVGAGIKHPALVWWAFGGILIAALLMLRVRPWRRAAAWAAAIAGVSLVGAAHYLHAFVNTGNPMYPVSVLGLAGNPEFELLHSGALTPQMHELSLGQLCIRLFAGAYAPVGFAHLNLGWGAPLAIVAGVVGWVRWIASPGGARPVAWMILLTAATTVLLLASPRVLVFRMDWWYVSGRYFAPAFAGLVLCAARARGRWPDGLLAAAVLLSLATAAFAARPLGFGAFGWAQAGVIVVLAVVTAALFLMIRKLARGRLLFATSILLLVLDAAAVFWIRQVGRVPTWRAAAAYATWDYHPLDARAAAAWPLWAQLDDDPPRRIAVTVGWDGVGQSTYLYPLMGARLQNRLEYVPVTRDGEVIDYRERERLVAALDPDRWYARLVAGGYDALVVLPPVVTPELAYVRAHPDRFEPLAEGDRGQGIALRIKRP